MSNYKQLSQRVNNLFAVIAEEEKRLEKAKLNSSGNQIELDNILGVFKQRLLDGKGTSLSQLETRISELQRDMLRDTALIKGLTEKIPVLKSEHEGIIAEKNEAFAKLAGKWLDREIKQYDEAIMRAKETARRLLCLYRMLREIEKPEVYRDALGEAYSYLPSQKFMTITDFDKTIFLTELPLLYAGPELTHVIETEITEGK